MVGGYGVEEAHYATVGAALIAAGQLKGELATLGFGSATFIHAELE